MRPILFHIPAIPVAGWIALVAVFFGLSAYWGLRDIEAEGLSAEERGRRGGERSRPTPCSSSSPWRSCGVSRTPSPIPCQFGPTASC